MQAHFSSNPIKNKNPLIIRPVSNVIKIEPPVKNVVGVQKITPKERHIIDSTTINIEDSMSKYNLYCTSMSFMSWEEIVKLSVCEITSSEFYGDGSLGDMRLGVLDKNTLCKTCHKTNTHCPGHCGRIKFNHSFPHPLLMKFIINLLQCVCNCCGEIILEDKILAKKVGHLKDPLLRVKLMADLSKGHNCVNSHKLKKNKCTINPIYNVTDAKETYKIRYSYGTSSKETDKFERTIEEVRMIFKSISDENCIKIGFENGNRPENLILDGLAVMPIQARPYNFQDGEKKQNYLSVAISDIINFNKNLDNNKIYKDNGADRDKNIMDLFKMIYYYMDNSDGNYSKTQDEKIITIKQKLIGKDGYIREFVSGKRVNYCARSVIGPPKKCKFGYVGVPRIMKYILTVPETITPYNHKRLLGLYKTGAVTDLIYKSSENDRRKGSHFKITDDKRDQYDPHIGDVVERHLQEDDYVLTNRQPTLHHYGLAGHRVFFHDDLNIKPHISTTTAYNADFDGDEENLHVLQTDMAISECKNTSNICSYVMNDQNNSPMMGLVFNCPKSAYIMTEDNMILDEKSWNEAIKYSEISKNRSLDARLKKYKIKKFSGKALFSTLLPENFYYDLKNIKIREGILISGRITKDHIGPSGGSIIQFLNKMHTKKDLIDFFTKGQYLLDWFLQWHGFSVGYDSCLADDPNRIKNVIKDEMAKAIIKIEALGDSENLKTKSEREKHEGQIINILNNAESIGKSISLEALKDNNPFKIMATSKSKGTVVNITQIMALLGQQLIRNKRPAKTLNNKKRSLPHFEENEKSLESRGFVSENFLEGISPAAEYFHCCASREGLVDTAAGTADVGAMHRRINKVLEDVHIDYTGNVVDKQTIFQYCFADGFDSKNLVGTKSIATGEVINFIDFNHVIGRLNLSYESQ